MSKAFEKMQQEWESAPNVGNVYTISIDDDAQINGFGLVTCKYHVTLSASHVGTDPLGVYRGSLAFSANADYSGLQGVLALLGGGLAADNSGWFKNDNFLARIASYTAEDEDLFNQTLGPAGQDEAAAALSGALESLVTAVNPDAMDTKAEAPLGMWCDWEYRMTEGDMDLYAAATAMGISSSHVYQSNDGHSITGEAKAFVPIVGTTIFEHIDEVVDGPFPYTLKLYRDGSAVFTLFSATATKTSVKFYGTWDAIPVEETQLV